MIPEDRRRALARTARSTDSGRDLIEQILVLAAGAAALLLLLLV